MTVGRGQEAPVVSVIVTHVGDGETSPARTLGKAARAVARKANVRNCILMMLYCRQAVTNVWGECRGRAELNNSAVQSFPSMGCLPRGDWEHRIRIVGRYVAEVIG